MALDLARHDITVLVLALEALQGRSLFAKQSTGVEEEEAAVEESRLTGDAPSGVCHVCIHGDSVVLTVHSGREPSVKITVDEPIAMLRGDGGLSRVVLRGATLAHSGDGISFWVTGEQR